jgi:hypothetical protein
MQIIPIHPGNILVLKKPHPCGGDIFRVLRVGSEVRIVCQSCGRDMTLDRVKLEKSIRRILPTEGTNKTEQEGARDRS